MTTDIASPALESAEPGLAGTPFFELEAYTPPKIEHGLAIVVADRSYIWIGTVTTEGDWTEIAGARIIRRWGTTEGLNQLIHGPTSKTVLDAPADLRVATHAVIAILPVEADKWQHA